MAQEGGKNVDLRYAAPGSPVEGDAHESGNAGHPKQPRTPDEIDLRDIVRNIVRRWRWIAAVTALLLASVVVYLHMAEYRYTVSLEITPVAAAQPSRLNDSIAGLASLAGINLARDSGTQSLDLYLAAFQSLDVAARLVDANNILADMFPAEWNPETNSWHPPERGATGAIIDTLKRALGMPVQAWKAPSPRRILTFLEDEITIFRPTDSPVITISIKTAHVSFGRNLLARLNQEADNIIRQHTLDRTQEYIAYLKKQLQQVSLAEYRTALIQALYEQEKSRMAASSNLPYSVEVFSGPVVSEDPTFPRPVLLLTLALIFGFLLSLCIIFLRDALRTPTLPET
jgi:Chain length determinant protein